MLELDVEDMARFISEETGIPYALVLVVLDSEEQYMKLKGIIEGE